MPDANHSRIPRSTVRSALCTNAPAFMASASAEGTSTVTERGPRCPGSRQAGDVNTAVFPTRMTGICAASIVMADSPVIRCTGPSNGRNPELTAESRTDATPIVPAGRTACQCRVKSCLNSRSFSMPRTRSGSVPRPSKQGSVKPHFHLQRSGSGWRGVISDSGMSRWS